MDINTIVNIQPKEFTDIKICQKFKIQIDEIILFKSVKFQVYLFTKDDEYIKSEYFCIENDEYKLWKEDDFLINYVLKKLSLYKA